MIFHLIQGCQHSQPSLLSQEQQKSNIDFAKTYTFIKLGASQATVEEAALLARVKAVMKIIELQSICFELHIKATCSFCDNPVPCLDVLRQVIITCRD